MASTRARGLRFGTAALLLAALSGCAEFEFVKWKKEQVPLVATAQRPAVEALCIWQSAEGRNMNGMPTRGFAGQILFFTHNNPSPVKVEGDVRIYVFDDQGPIEQRSKPIHQFDFTPQVWNSHLHHSMLGTAYNVFIPYTRSGTHQAQCGLRLRLTPSDGSPPLYSEMVNVTLPGKLDETADDVAKPQTASQIEKTVQERLQPLLQSGPKTGITTIPTAPAAPATPPLPVPSVSISNQTIAPQTVTPESQRLERLEQMLAQLLEAQTDAPAHPITPSPAVEPHQPARRFKLPAAQPAAKPPATSWYSGAAHSNQPGRTDTTDAGTAPPKRRHPLAEEPAGQRPTDAWPLEPDQGLVITKEW